MDEITKNSRIAGIFPRLQRPGEVIGDQSFRRAGRSAHDHSDALLVEKVLGALPDAGRTAGDDVLSPRSASHGGGRADGSTRGRSALTAKDGS